jgi:hypothetical protein
MDEARVLIDLREGIIELQGTKWLEAKGGKND